MTFYHGVYVVAFIVNVITAFTVIFMERRNVEATLAWLSVLLFFPILGFVLYLLIGRKLGKRALFKLKPVPDKFIEQLAERQKRDLLDGNLRFYQPETKDYAKLLYMNLNSNHAYFTEDNRVDIFTEGIKKFESLFRDIESAQKSIHLQYYIVKNDRIGQRIRDLIVAKAQQGVEVRFLYDAFGSMDLPNDFFSVLKAAGGEACAFFPAKLPFINTRINHRNHRKIAIIDGQIAYIGGFNIGDEYLGLNPQFGPWRDTHLRIEGGAVIQLQALFLLDWNVASERKTTGDMRHYPTSVKRGTSGIQIISSGPEHPVEQVRNAYIRMIFFAERFVDIQTPYFIPDESLLTALRTAALSGVTVRIMLPSKPDHKLVYWASMYYVGELLSSGVQFFLYEKGFLHAKTVVVDGCIASVGTANIDIRSFKLNFEVNALLYDRPTVHELQELFEHDLKVCRRLTEVDYRNRPKLHRVRESIARLLSPIL